MRTQSGRQRRPNLKEFNQKFKEVQGHFERLSETKRQVQESESKAERTIASKNLAFEMSRLKKESRLIKAQIIPENGEVKPDNLKNVLTLLRWERQRGLLPVSDEYLLNRYELASIKDAISKGDSEWSVATCKNQAPSAFHINVGENVYYSQEFNEVKQKDYVTFYVEFTIPGENQIGKALELKISRGFQPDVKDFPEDKTLVKRFVLSKSEFNRYFIDEDYV